MFYKIDFASSIWHMLICKKNISYLWFNTFGYFSPYGKSGGRKIHALVQQLRWESATFWPYTHGCKLVLLPHIQSRRKRESWCQWSDITRKAHISQEPLRNFRLQLRGQNMVPWPSLLQKSWESQSTCFSMCHGRWKERRGWNGCWVSRSSRVSQGHLMSKIPFAPQVSMQEVLCLYFITNFLSL